MKNEKFRPLSNWEASILDRLFEVNFSGREQLLRQRQGLLAKQIDEDGSLQFEVQSRDLSSANGPVVDGLVVEGRCPEKDGADESRPAVNFLLHVKRGKLWMLEIYKDDSTEIMERPDPRKLVVFTAMPADK